MLLVVNYLIRKTVGDVNAFMALRKLSLGKTSNVQLVEALQLSVSV